MSLSDQELADVVAELATVLPGGLLEKINAPSPESCQLLFRARGADWVLRIDLGPGKTRLHLCLHKSPAPQNPPTWVMKCRAEIQGRVLSEIIKEASDRVVRLVFRAGAECPEKTMLAELFGRRGRLLLLDQNGDVLYPLIGKGNPSEPYRLLTQKPSTRPALSRFPPPEATVCAANRAIEAFYEGVEATRNFTELCKRTAGEIERRRKRFARRLSNLEQDLARAADGENLKRCGEALKFALHQVRKGDRRVQLADPHNPLEQSLVFDLDPALNPVENMQRLFARGRRLALATPGIQKRIAEVRQSLQLLDRLAQQLISAADEEAVLELRALLSLPRAAPNIQTGRKKTEPRRPFHSYRSTAGKTILVGRSGKDNHALTFRVAAGSDLWLHARGTAGAHVVVKLSREEQVDPQTLLDAATLAAHASSLKADSRVEVTYTRVKNVHPVKGASPGLVSVARGRTILVRVEPERLRRILETKDLS